jgi:AcrR family transcriptional regulator
MTRKAGETSGKGNGSARQWRRTADTRKALLCAASEVFCEDGFADASIAAIVERAGSSVGSLYHHFGGKTELFLALWERTQADHERNTAAAVAKAKASGEYNPLTLFNIGTRAYLKDVWQWRDLERLFVDADTPPGFEVVRRTQAHEWIRQNGVLLDLGDDLVDRLTVDVVSNIVTAAILEVATSPSQRQANAVIDAALDLIQRVYSPPRPS